jgi:glycosyltransferase involved in cell wall biosynthesis
MQKLFPIKYHHDDVGRRIAEALLHLKQHEKIDVFEIEESFGWGQIASQANVPVILRLHGPWIINGQINEESRSEFYRRVQQEGKAISSATRITAASRFVLDSVRSYYRVELANSQIILNPIAASEKRWQLTSCDFDRILYVGRFDRAKGADIVLKAFSILAKTYPALRLTFVGPDFGIKEDDGKMLHFQEYVTKHFNQQIWERIDFKGRLPHSDVMELRTTHLFGVVSSRFEILPYSVIEAMALGCPIVASAVGGIPELITNKRNGLLFKSEDVHGLVDASSHLLNNRTYAAALGEQARMDCELRLDPDRAAGETLAVYEQAMREYGKRLTRP